jgi:hypothetical protein
MNKTALSECPGCIHRLAMEANTLQKSVPESAVQNMGFIYGLFNGTRIL